MKALLRQCRRPGVGLAFIALAACLAGGGCARTHLTSSHGRAYHEVFAAQDANPDRKTTKPVHGLDSQEAAIIAGSYRKALAPKTGDSGAQQQMLMVAPQRGNDSSSLPASVPAQ
jgi:hypothetical protein